MTSRSGCIAIYILLMGVLDCGWAGGGTLVSLPWRGQKLTNGIMVDVDARWVEGWGYRPITVRLRTKKSRADRTLSMVVLPNSYSRHYIPLSCRYQLEIPQGSNSVSKTIYIPKREHWHQFRVEFFENGRKLKDISMENAMPWTNNYWRSDDGPPAVLLLDSDAPTLTDRPSMVAALQGNRDKEKSEAYLLPDARKFQYLVDDYQGNGVRNVTDDEGRSSDLDSLAFLVNAANVDILPPRAIPESHMGLSGVDLTVISLADLAQMAKDEATRFDALKRFVLGGGNLLVFDEGMVFEQVGRLLGVPEPWQPADPAKYRFLVASFQQIHDSSYGISPATRKQMMDVKQFPEFQVANLGLGRVAAARTKDLYQQRVSYLQWILNSIGNDRMLWSTRHGISTTQSNQDYWDFMIPGFGKAPVKSFLFTICLFIIAIGPMNYFLLQRWKRLYLLPITVGVAALVTTVAMLGFAVVSDGLSTRVRLRSFTYLDQAAKLAATHCRQAYLAAIAPSDGLKFPSRTCVYPLLPSVEQLQRGEIQNDRTELRQLDFGYLRSRSNTQFLTTQVEQAEASLEVDQTGDVVRVTNKLGVDLEYLWLIGEHGDLRRGTGIKADAAIELLAETTDNAKQEIDVLLSKHRPAPPDGIDKTANNQTFFGAMFSVGWRGQGSPVDFQSGLMELNIANMKRFIIEARPGTYIAVTYQAPPFVVLGTRASQEAGFHVIRGSWGRP